MRPLTIKRVQIYAFGDESIDRPSWRKDMHDVYTTNIVCRITTEEGLEGIGGTIDYVENRFNDIILQSASLYANGLIGRSALDRGEIYNWMSRRPSWLPLPTMSMIDIALWDLMGKYANLPVYQMAGAHRDRILAYASSPTCEDHQGYFDYIEKAMAAGFKSVKIHPFTFFDLDYPLVKEISERYGNKMLFTLDPDSGYTRKEALKMCKLMEQYDCWEWFESPLPDRDLEGYKYLHEHTPINISDGGNCKLTLMDVNNYCKENAYTDLRIDVTNCGGFTPMLKIMALSQAYNMQCEIQSWGNIITKAAAVHMMCACTNCTYFEMNYPYEDFEVAAKTLIRIDEDGYVHVPQGPGLGIELDWDEVERLSVSTYDTDRKDHPYVSKMTK